MSPKDIARCRFFSISPRDLPVFSLRVLVWINHKPGSTSGSESNSAEADC